jgi:hypothetical protein
VVDQDGGDALGLDLGDLADALGVEGSNVPAGVCTW